MHNLIGQSLGRYHILEQLGEGGMAIVYKAYDTRLERDVAVKVIRTEKLTLETMGKTLKRFEREAKALAKLTHPNIVPITDYGEHDDRPYLVMPYLPGGTLKQRLKGKPMQWEDAVRLLIPIARALHYAHQQGIIHRDVKPSNILITQSGEPMLTDFGIAKILIDTEDTFDLTGTGMGIGTPEYMSPEQFQGKGVDARTDIYSLGVVLYEMVTGKKPYQADTPAAILIKQVTEPLPRPKSFMPDLPDGLEKILLKALARASQDRYLDMVAFAVALERSGSPLPSSHPELGQRVAKDPSLSLRNEEVRAPRMEDSMSTIDQLTDSIDAQAKVVEPAELSQPAQQAQTDNVNRAPRWRSVIWITLGWAISWGISRAAIGGAISGFVISLVMRREGILSSWKAVIWITLGWAIGWGISETISKTIIGWAIGGFVTALVICRDGILSSWKTVLWVTLGWAISGAISWAVGKPIAYELGGGSGFVINDVIGWEIGWAIGWLIGGAIGGTIMVWRLRQEGKQL